LNTTGQIREIGLDAQKIARDIVKQESIVISKTYNNNNYTHYIGVYFYFFNNRKKHIFKNISDGLGSCIDQDDKNYERINDIFLNFETFAFNKLTNERKKKVLKDFPFLKDKNK